MTGGRKKSLGIHLLVFIAVHALLYAIIRSDISSPDWLLWFREAATSGTTGFYHEPTGIYINGLWLLIMIIDALYTLWGKEETAGGKKDMADSDAAGNPERDLQPVSSSKSASSASTAERRDNPWVFLMLGGLLEIVWAVLLKMNLLGGPLLVIFYFSFYCLTRAAKTLPVSTVAAAFAGIGAAGTVAMDMLFFDREIHWVRLGLIVLLIFFILLLKLGSEYKRRA
ncbi:Multidrug resistance protein ykkC [Chlamydia abortus]|uniref:DMT family transporter n=1 Tax=Paenibacillus residui TaxID=629724 RepID=A0ABW3DCT5_9BACL|nr:Multidrug resistance protein ykkC [Chlamydia abortus]